MYEKRGNHEKAIITSSNAGQLMLAEYNAFADDLKEVNQAIRAKDLKGLFIDVAQKRIWIDARMYMDATDAWNKRSKDQQDALDRAVKECEEWSRAQVANVTTMASTQGQRSLLGATNGTNQYPYGYDAGRWNPNPHVPMFPHNLGNPSPNPAMVPLYTENTFITKNYYSSRRSSNSSSSDSSSIPPDKFDKLISRIKDSDKRSEIRHKKGETMAETRSKRHNNEIRAVRDELRIDAKFRHRQTLCRDEVEVQFDSLNVRVEHAYDANAAFASIAEK